ncbi:flagellar filament capping protein FliD [Selenomonas artemidis]|uniref:flagellar filament capping protein FliD n=1 Tax=Selenomonas artemidis TaxID=671224 RepID=UPI002889E71A|nr:flagellar filament capping protein FliD [Selenomonas artemidis]
MAGATGATGSKGIYGLSGSGIDVESLVKVGMLSQQKRYDRIYKKEVETEWRKEAYANVYEKLSTFQNSTLSNYKLSATTKPMTATSSNTDAVTAVANASAGLMTHNVEVSETAKNAYLMTATGAHVERANTAASAAKSMMLKDIAYAGGTKPASMANTDVALRFKVSDGTNTTTVEFTAEEVFDKNLTLNDLATRINNARYKDTAGKNAARSLSASYDTVSDAFSIVNTKTGAENKIELSVESGTGDMQNASAQLLTNLKLGDVNNNPGTAQTYSAGTTNAVTGVNGKVKIDGREYDNLQENKLTVGGVTYTFKQKTTAPAQVGIAQDQDKLLENVKKFVEEYNKLLDDLNKQYSEGKYRDYGVLTKTQEDGMTKEQVEKWNEKAKSGLLYRDEYLRSIISDMRDAVTNRVGSVPGRYNSLASIGITSKDQKGHLQVDERKLKNAIAAEPDAVNRLMSYDDPDNDYNNSGVANRLYNKVTSRLKSLENHAGRTADKTDVTSELGKLIQNYQKQMSDFKQLMTSFENNLYKKYNAMEVAISRLSAQFNFFAAK